MKRFELVAGTSSKFWEVSVSGSDLTVRFGRIGTSGQTKTKALASAAAAEKERDKLIKEKTGGGYKEVTVAAGATLAPVKTEPRETSAKQTPVAESPVEQPAPSQPAVAKVAEVAPAPAPSKDIEWPTGGFQWTAELRKSLPIVRGINVPPLPALQSSPLEPFEFKDEKYLSAGNMQALASAAGRPWTYWGAAGSRERITTESLRQADHEFWLEMFAQTLCAFQPKGMDWVISCGRSLHGIAFMLEVTLEMWAIMSKNPRYYPTQLFGDLRHAIAAADDAEYAAALAVATKVRAAGNSEHLMPTAYLFPHLTEWVLEAMERKLDSTDLVLAQSVIPPEALYAHLHSKQWYLYYLAGALLLQAHLHGERAFDLLALALKKAGDRDNIERALRLLTAMRVPQLIEVLVDRIESKEVRAALDKEAERYPAAVLQTCLQKWLANSDRSLEGWLVRLALRKQEAAQSALATLDAGGRAKFEALLAALNRTDADPASLPELLRNPPWLQKRKAQELPTLTLQQLPVTDTLQWSQSELQQHAGFKPNSYALNNKPANEPQDHYLLKFLDIAPTSFERILRGEPFRPEDQQTREYRRGYVLEHVMLLPEKVVLSLWNSFPAQGWYSWSDHNTPAILALLARHGLKALPGFLAYAQANTLEGLTIAAKIDSAALAPMALHALRNLKKAKSIAAQWISAHPRTTAIVALPVAFGTPREERDNARFGLRWLMQNGFENVARDVANEYGAEGAAALQALLDADPLLVLPAKMPKIPPFFVPASFRRPELPDGGALPVSACEYIGNMLTISRLDAPYPGIQIVRETCTSASLAEFAWDLFEAWLASGAPSKEGWAFQALGLLGNDETARRLTPRIREWPGEAAHARAVTGLDILAAIGTDAALMHLNAIAAKVKFKGLQDKAREKIDAIAEARGLTAAELADRLVPDLGLDEDGRLKLDFGPRQFYASFDETLKPLVRDAQGTRLKDLPKPNKSDDAALAEAATERYKQLKKDAKSIASVQLIRLELAMIARRRWSAADFKLFFVDHPLTRHLSARLVWGVYRDGQMVTAFRVAEDWTLADDQDSLYELPSDATVGIAHVLEMPQPLQAAFGQIFADYEILQPFRQLGRETYALTENELRGTELTRFKDKFVATGSVMGLINRGWERGAAQDGGWVGHFSKPIDDQYEVQIELDPGTVVGDVSYEPKQRIPSVMFRKSGTWDQHGLVKFSKLDPVLASEVLRDLELMAPFAGE
ncbi:DUF4132 domain-containing protein [Steroidobacter agaridevorans]|uniref:DUF4132 domain-containing protein n=1 Tax=Steroidobacter agaridevorans TaxID=2695856 RepID=UPI001328C218|nr:DUF4132 domain-containing protein [Steroidobacter agaridevorans]GFE89433.1 hypothetical protein GCM10011488_43870 [Steroidobacter agaridevorans]